VASDELLMLYHDMAEAPHEKIKQVCQEELDATKMPPLQQHESIDPLIYEWIHPFMKAEPS
jgi:hypothetical protein